MGLSQRGMDEWLADLESLPERAPRAFRGVMSRAGVQIKLDWKAGWKAISTAGHIPHLIRFIGYDLSEKGFNYSVEAGPKAGTLQSGLAAYITYGTLTSAPHDAGQHALDVELPKMQAAAAKVAEDLLDGKP